MSLEEVAKQLYCSSAKISRIENTRVGTPPRDARDLAVLYGATTQQAEALEQLALDARPKDNWWNASADIPDARTFASLERGAASIRVYGSLIIPGLLQTELYARRIIGATFPCLSPSRSGATSSCEWRANHRWNGSDPPYVSTLIEESALHRPVGGHQVMRAQLRALLGHIERPNVSLHVLQFGIGEHGGMLGPFTILGFADPTDPDIVHLEHSAGDLYLREEDDVDRYLRLFADLQAVAASSEDSFALIEAAAAAL
jgi:hypothetical protein